jgi:hypothetical protein
MTVAEAYCARHHCSPSHFEERVFRECLHSHAAPFAALLFRSSPKKFREDQLVIQQVGLARTLEEVDAALSDFQYINHSQRHWLRTGLKIRISGRKLRMLAAALLEMEEMGGRANSPVLAHSQSQPTQ